MKNQLDSELLLFEEIRKHSKLDDEEVLDLIKKAQGGDNWAKERLVNHNLWIIKKVALKFHPAKGMEFMDLFQEGYYGLKRAIEKYDPTEGANFHTYAYRGAYRKIQTAVIHKTSIIRTPFYLNVEQKKVRKAIGTLSTNLEKEKPTKEDLADYLGYTVDQVEKIADRTVRTVYLEDFLIEQNGDIDRLSCMADKHNPSSLTMMIVKEEFQSYCEKLKILIKKTKAFSHRRREVFLERYGLKDDWEKKTYVQIAKKWGGTRQNIDQMIKRIWQFFGSQSFDWNESWLEEQMTRLEELSKMLNYSQEELTKCVLKN